MTVEGEERGLKLVLHKIMVRRLEKGKKGDGLLYIGDSGADETIRLVVRRTFFAC